MMYRYILLTGVLTAGMAWGDDKELSEAIVSGRYDLLDQQVSTRLKQNDNDGAAHFANGFAKTLRGLERFGRTLYQAGAGNRPARTVNTFGLLGTMQLPIPPNPQAVPLEYEAYRRMLTTLQQDLDQAGEELAKVKPGEFKLRIPVGLLGIDINGDGILIDDERAWQILARGSGQNSGVTREVVEKYVLAFDYADAIWLRGYCMLTSAWLDALLSLDVRQSYEFAFKVLSDKQLGLHSNWDANMDSILDAIAMIHLTRFPVVAPERMTAARTKLLKVIGNSREMIKAVNQETDDDQEWIPNSRQTSQVPAMRVTSDTIAVWSDFLDEFEDILEGKKLVPHFRFKAGHGINLKKFMENVKVIDLVMLVHGIDFLPYVEEGPTTSMDTWRDINRRSGNNLIGLGFWFN